MHWHQHWTFTAWKVNFISISQHWTVTAWKIQHRCQSFTLTDSNTDYQELHSIVMQQLRNARKMSLIGFPVTFKTCVSSKSNLPFATIFHLTWADWVVAPETICDTNCRCDICCWGRGAVARATGVEARAGEGFGSTAKLCTPMLGCSWDSPARLVERSDWSAASVDAADADQSWQELSLDTSLWLDIISDNTANKDKKQIRSMINKAMDGRSNSQHIEDYIINFYTLHILVFLPDLCEGI